MKRFWVVLMVLGLIAAFSTTVFAVDVKFSGEYYAAGMYLDKTSLNKNTWTSGSGTLTDPYVDHKPGPSTAFYYQRLRVRTDFVVAPGLSLITRFDAMERAWGASRSTVGKEYSSALNDSAGTIAENENIAWDWAYVEYKSPIGVFNVGYMNYGSTGTIFGNNSAPQARIKYSYAIGPVTINPAISKVKEGDRGTFNTSGVTDADNDVYHLEGVYSWKGGKAGLNINYYNYANSRPSSNYSRNYFLYTPYVMAKIGPVALQAEFNYLTGEQEYDNGTADIDLQGISGWVDATADFKMFYVGGSIAYVSGDDKGTAKNEGYSLNGGRDWNPCLIMWNYERTNWAGTLDGYPDAVANDTYMTNAWFFQVRGGLRPVDKLDIMASVAYARADKPNTVLDKDYGFEVDLTGTYKITNNLSYMLGMGYLFTGDYYKGTNGDNDINNDFLVINKLTLTF